MSEQQKNNAPQSEEIDLGQLFKLIGDAFNRFFRFIASIFKGLFSLLISFLLFIQKHFIKFAIAGIVGVGGGIYWDSVSDPIYRSSMVVEPNFNSAQQLYNNIEFYNELAAQQDFETLAQTFDISKEEAGNLKKFEVESFSDEAQKMQQFSEFIQSLDTTSQKLVDYENYLKNFNNINARFHRISVEAKDSRVAKTLQEPIVESIEDNAYFNLQKRINDDNIKLSDSLYSGQLKEVYTLQEFYKKIKLKEAEKEQASTSISMGETKESGSDEIKLLEQVEDIKNSMLELNMEKANTQNTINVISDFPDKGVEVNDWNRSKKILLPLLLLGLVFGFLILIELNKYLKKFKA